MLKSASYRTAKKGNSASFSTTSQLKLYQSRKVVVPVKKRKFLYSFRNNIINIVFSFGLCHTVILFMTFNKVKQQTKWHQPHLALRQIEMGDAVIQEPGEQFRVVYPAVAFFESFSLSTLRCVPLNSASVIADLYSVRSCGVVRISTSSSVSRALGLSLCLML